MYIIIYLVAIRYLTITFILLFGTYLSKLSDILGKCVPKNIVMFVYLYYIPT